MVCTASIPACAEPTNPVALGIMQGDPTGEHDNSAYDSTHHRITSQPVQRRVASIRDLGIHLVRELDAERAAPGLRASEEMGRREGHAWQ